MGAIPALLIHCSIGTVYCWSLLRNSIAESLNCSASDVEWAFSLAIFFLGMSAAFAGNLVEKNVKRSALLSSICFFIGMFGTGLSIEYGSLAGVLIFYGLIMGIGLGVGYLTPVKTLMMWFSNNKGLATGIAITGFGLAKVIASPIIAKLLLSIPVSKIFYILGIVYLAMMLLGALLIKKPKSNLNLAGNSFNFKDGLTFIKNKKFVAIWAVFFINITCGLALISQEKSLLMACGMGASVTSVSSLTAFFNSFGRLGYSSWSDVFKDRSVIYIVIFLLSTYVCLFCGSIPAVILIVTTLIVCNAGYGGGFSTLPSMLSDKFGLKNVSVIHGYALSAWAFAGLVGNHLGNFMLGSYGVQALLITLSIIYFVGFLITLFYVRGK